MEQLILNVDGMSCNHCAQTIKNKLKDLKGIEDTLVDLSNKTVTITYDQSVIHKEAFSKAIEKEGYTVH